MNSSVNPYDMQEALSGLAEIARDPRALALAMELQEARELAAKAPPIKPMPMSPKIRELVYLNMEALRRGIPATAAWSADQLYDALRA